ncbi:MAG: GNAT family N-acetyltransferase [Sneathiellales bacterium]|nr:GNAT family N-acetyltransferase [Sneathiellales bacterium]
MFIREVKSDELETILPRLGAILLACVEEGASVGFVEPFGQKESEAFFEQSVFPDILAKKRVLLVAEIDAEIAGTVQLQIGMLPNQTHRGEVGKLLVDPAYRRRGIGRALMLALEVCAEKAEKSLLTLDTRTGDMAEPLYTALGFQTAGVIPNYCRAPEAGSTVLDSTTYMFKQI